MVQIQAFVAEYGLLVGGGLLLLALMLIAVTTVKNLLSKRKARAGDAQRDEALKAKVLAKTGAAALTEGLVAVRVDFDAPENRALVERYVVLSLPTVVVLTPEASTTNAGRSLFSLPRP